jgi:transcription-repair coupling factor (superfamily II helicase)
VEKTVDLIDIYTKDQRTQRLADALISPKARVQLAGLIGAQAAVVMSATFLAQPRNHLFIAIDKEEALYLHSNIESILNKKDIRFFSDSFKTPMRFETLDNDNVLSRTETVNRLITGLTSGELIITYPEALFEKVVAPAELEKTRFEISIGEDVDIDFLIQMLVDYGFNRVNFVYAPGEFSIRGGIIDIFSYGNEKPYRIELFDEEVESIRTFDPATQLSIQKISKVSIVPNINTRFDNTQKISLFKVLPADTVIWIDDFQLILDKLQRCFEKAEDFLTSLSVLDESDLAEIFRDRAFLYPNNVIEELQTFPLVMLNNVSKDFTFTDKIIYKSKPQPSFNKNFDLLIENLHENKSNLYTNYIFIENPKQVERLYMIFEDLKAEVDFRPIPYGVHQGFIDQELKIACYTDHQIFERYHRFRTKTGFSHEQSMTIRLLRELQPGDFVTHIDHGVGKFSGLEKIELGGKQQEHIRLLYKDRDILYVGINSLHKISKYVGKEGEEPKLHKIGSDTWKNLKAKTKKQIKDMAEELIKLYAKRKAAPGFQFSKDGYLQNELEASFIYEDTPDQLKATNDVKEDMEKPNPMDRLICGDVGFGKTEIAIRAAFKAACDGKQVAILVPTTILALQHYKTFSERFKDFPVTVDYINRFRTSKEKKDILEKLKAGKIDIIIGTHGLAAKDVVFKDLGLLIIDEEQKFGVAVKEKLRAMQINVDTLVLTATPIPRTLQFSLMAARDLSIIKTPPPNRQSIHTEVRLFNLELIKEVIYKEVQRGGQVYFVHNRVASLADMVTMLRTNCPDIDIEMAHGQLEPEKLENTLVDFINKKFDVLVCTNIIETGLDIPNANTIIINNAHQFGLSDLHQLRGRVGRSNRKAYCFLLGPPVSVLTPEARKRLKTIEEFSDIGSGFDVAMRDLDIRGAGNILGGEQSGFISEIGFHTYQKILEEAIIELKEADFEGAFPEEKNKKQVYLRDTEIETDVEMLIPDEYVENIQERLNLYTTMDALQTEEEIHVFGEKMKDRFGKLPEQVLEIFEGLRLRWLAKELGFERIILKEGKLRCYFILNPQSKYYETPTFQKVMKFINGEGKKNQFSIKQTPKSLIMVRENVRTLKGAKRLLDLVAEKVIKV